MTRRTAARQPAGNPPATPAPSSPPEAPAGMSGETTATEREALATLRRLALDAVNAVGLCPCSDPDGDCAKVRALSDALPPEDEHG